MSHGFIAYNNVNQVLVSSETRNLHFLGKATYSSTDKSDDNYGGTRIYTFTIECSTFPVPFFTNPTGQYMAISRIYNPSGNTWNIEVIRSGTGTTKPEVYVFADPRAGTPSGSFGMVVYRDDQSVSFDSRLRPLAITGGLTVTHASNPRTFPSSGLAAKDCASDDATCGSYFAPDASNITTIDYIPAKPMFFYPSLAQAERENVWTTSEEDCLGSDKLNVCISKDYYQWASRYWAFYRGGISYASHKGSTQADIFAGWITVDHGCNHYYNHSSSLFSVFDILAIPIGSSSWSGGKWPYSNKTINTSAATVIIGDAARYD